VAVPCRDTILRDALVAARGAISDYYPGAHALGAFAAARAINDEDRRAEVLAELALTLAQSELRDALAAIVKDCSGGQARLENPALESIWWSRIC